ncbi:F0F1 ATP synthase subunit A [Mycoplasmopsis glycophila]|uniref:F-ATPase subunit 6 n=1 Tax=Mycoplasmopsis glycophila TaxID=171285 RepID=A0A449AUX6_9BACT|nr:F0F1 ATP synthase subunit A [Mycoplasmopsis glycophila]VEU70311.1 F-ATPase subunit 6 [Mycoplasmopsis glycophila]
MLEKLKEWAQPQLLSLVVTVLVILILSFLIYFKVKKVKHNKAPTGIAFIAEAYVGVIDKQFHDVVGDKRLQKAKTYIFALATFLLVGNAVAFIGLEPIVTSYSVPFTLALASWLGILASGMIYRKWKYLKAFMLPTDVIGKISPLISLSFRIYGNIIGGSCILFLIYAIFGSIGNADAIAGKGFGPVTFIASPLTAAFHFYFDVFGSTLQAYIFTLLTSVYWLIESEQDEKPKAEKRRRILVFKKTFTKKQSATIY